MVRQDSDFKVVFLYEMESRKRWPEKSAGRAWATWVEALIFLDLFCLGLDEMVIPPKAGRKVTQYPDNKQGLERKSGCFSRIGLR
jgi:hypothetical protein